jgi:hypothetical protein
MESCHVRQSESASALYVASLALYKVSAMYLSVALRVSSAEVQAERIEIRRIEKINPGLFKIKSFAFQFKIFA